MLENHESRAVFQWSVSFMVIEFRGLGLQLGGGI